MAVKNSVQAITLQSFDVSGLVAGFQTIDATGLPEPCLMIRFINDSDTEVIVSYNGTDDQEYVLSNDDVTLNFQTNSQPSNNMALLAKGTQIYVRGVAGTGDFILVGYYQPVL
jgi:hypothetical protein